MREVHERPDPGQNYGQLQDAATNAAEPGAFFVINTPLDRSGMASLTRHRRRGPGTQGGWGSQMNKPVYMTAEGLERLQNELRVLITADRPRVAHRIHEAKLDGDISENAEYEDAKQEQSFLEGRIATLEAQIRHAEVIEATNSDKVGIGSKVRIKGGDGEETFTIVGSAEAAPREGRISNESPVGVALMGRKKGDKVTVRAPAGAVEYTVVAVN
jgi:transcription elongation factor GreA